MPTDPVKLSVAKRRHYENNKQQYLDRAKVSRQKRIDFVHAAKLDKPCIDCGVVYPPQIMHYHHRPGEVKRDSIATLVRNAGIPAIVAEIKKCDLLCSNCHGLRHLTEGSMGLSR